MSEAAELKRKILMKTRSSLKTFLLKKSFTYFCLLNFDGHIDDLISWLWSYSEEPNKSECDSENLVLIDVCVNLLTIRNKVINQYSKFTKSLQIYIDSRKFIQIFKNREKKIKVKQKFFQGLNSKQKELSN